MRPLRLEMTAFGPFAETQVVDFRELGAAQLFLICGETGAGKSAILDGLCAALYGESSGGERSVAQLRSDHADPKVVTALRLDFRVGEHTYRVERTPAQRRARVRGDGYVDQPASATLWQLASDAPDALVVEVLAERKVREVDAHVLGLVKLEAAQFRRVVVLPQGDFRQLLSADSQAREKLLEKLFDTLAWKRVEDELAQRAKRLGRVLQDAEQHRRGLLESQGETQLEVLVAKVEGHERALAHVALAAREASDRAQEAVARRAEGRTLGARFEALRVERDRERSLDAREPEVQLLRDQLTAARAAEAIAPVFDAADQAAKEHARRATQQQRAAQALVSARARVEPLASAARDAAAEHELRTERERARNDAEARAQAAREWAARQQTLAEAEAGSATAKHAFDVLEGVHREAQQALERLTAERAQVADAAAQQARAESDLAAVLARRSLHQKAAGLDRELCGLESGVATAAQQEQAAAEALADASAALRAIEAAMHAGHAAVLAHTLHDGQPCPVCGSSEHPAPAARDAATPSEADHAAAERSANKARDAHGAAQKALAAAEAKRDAKRLERLTQREPLGHETLPDVEQRVTALTAALTEANARLATKSALEVRHTELLASTSKTATTLEAAREAQVRAAARLDAAKTEAAAAHARLNGEPADAERWATQAARLTREIEAAQAAYTHTTQQLSEAEQGLAAAVSAAASATAELDAAVTQRDLAAARWATQRATSPFPDDAAFGAARLPAARLAQLAADLQQHADARLALQTRLAGHLEALAGQLPPDLHALELAASQALAASDAATKHHANVQTSARRGRDLVTQIERGLATSETQLAEYRAVSHLSSVASGQNGAKMNLHRFVLAAFLEEVLTQANQHMQHTSQGRYELVRRSLGGDSRRAQGLDLDVHDHYTGEARPSTTLSGGEGFLAALALALGLADVVRAHFGGVPIEAVFIDEGFGSLDAETLDLVIEALLRLQRTGRMVGIISHVPELRERVDVLLEVKKGVHGSTARFCVPS